MRTDQTMAKMDKALSPKLHLLKYEMGVNSFNEVFIKLIQFWYANQPKEK